jgi:hypothetical protein
MRSLRGRIKAVGTYLAERREADRFQPEGWETAEGRAILSQYRAEMNGKPVDGELVKGQPVDGELVNGQPVNGELPGADFTGSRPARVIRGVARVARQLASEITMPIQVGSGVTRGAQGPSSEVAHRTPHTLDRRPRHASGDVAMDTGHRPRHACGDVAVDSGHRPRHDGTQSPVGSSYLLTRPPTTRHGVPDEPVPVGPAETARVLTITNVIHGPDGDPLAGAIVTISLIADHVPGFPQAATIDGVARIVPAGAAEITRASLTGRALVRTPVSRCEESE